MIKPGTTIDIPPYGYVRYVDHLGTDSRIVEAARISYHSPAKGDEADKKLLAYLYRNRHTSPFEQCNITFNIKFPIFLMRQFVRHRTFRLNEVSARYTELPDEFFLPEKWRKQDYKNKQGSLATEDWDHVEDTMGPNISKNEWLTKTVSKAYASIYDIYLRLLEEGVAKEQARFVLPVGIYTEIYVNCDLHNLLHFLHLRQDGHAQAEIQDVANAIKHITKELFPWTMEVFNRFKLKVEDTYEINTGANS